MKVNELYAQAKALFEQYEDEYRFIGIRFENKQREIGETCECSKHNRDREDDRDFPEYGSDEYEDMYEFDGTSAWSLADSSVYSVAKKYGESDVNSLYCDTEHCYIIAGQYRCNQNDDLDDGEVVIEEAKVLAQLF
jgi:hypothetical protein